MFPEILVVDDSPLERLLVEGLFRRHPQLRIELAENGKEALALLAARPPALVVTDLVMPEMDGLELIRCMRERYPDIPVILMTGYGDESIAMEALEAGAASYIPKAQRARRLVAAALRILERTCADRSRQQVTQSMLEYHCRFALENDRHVIRALAEQLEQAMAGIGFTDTVERIRIGEALEEALLNAMYHGNLELSREELAQAWDELDEYLLDKLVEQRRTDPRISGRKILVVAHLTQSESRFVIRDEGRGFNTTFEFAGGRSDRFESGRQRGLTLMRTIMDEVAFNKAGNELMMRKYRRERAADGGTGPHAGSVNTGSSA